MNLVALFVDLFVCMVWNLNKHLNTKLAIEFLILKTSKVHVICCNLKAFVLQARRKSVFERHINVVLFDDCFQSNKSAKKKPFQVDLCKLGFS